MERGTSEKYSLEEAWLPHNFGTTCLGVTVPSLLRGKHEIVGRSTVDSKDCLEVIAFKKSVDSDGVDIPSIHFWLDDKHTLLVRRALLLVELRPDQAPSSQAFSYNDKLIDVMSEYRLRDHFNLAGIDYPKWFTIEAISPIIAAGFETETIVDPANSFRGVDVTRPFTIGEDVGLLIKDLRTGEFRPPGRTGEALKGIAIKAKFKRLMELLGREATLEGAATLDDQHAYDLNCADLAMLFYNMLRQHRIEPALLGGGTNGTGLHDRSIAEICSAFSALGYLNVSSKLVKSSALTTIEAPCVGMATNVKTGIAHFYLLRPHADKIFMVGPGGGVGYLSKDLLDVYSGGFIDVLGPDLSFSSVSATWDNILVLCGIGLAAMIVLGIVLRTRTGTKLGVVGSCLCLLLSFSKIRESSGSLVCDGSTEYEAGEVMPGEDVQHDFLLRNDSDQQMSILEINRSCGCTHADVSRKIVRPGEVTVLSVTMRVTGPFGRSETVYVSWTSADKKDTLTCRISAAIRSHDRLIIDKEAVVLHVPERRLRGQRQHVERVGIMYVSRESLLERIDIESPSWLDATCAPTTVEDAGFGYRKQTFELTLASTVETLPGMIGNVILSSNTATAEGVSIRVTVEPMKDFEIDPPSIFIQDVRKLQGPSCVHLRRLGASRAEVSDVLAEPWIGATIQTNEQGYVLCATPTNPPEGVLAGEIVLRVDGGVQEHVTISIAGLNHKQ